MRILCFAAALLLVLAQRPTPLESDAVTVVGRIYVAVSWSPDRASVDAPPRAVTLRKALPDTTQVCVETEAMTRCAPLSMFREAE